MLDYSKGCFLLVATTFLSGFAGDATMQWLEGVTQFDFYDNPEDVTRAADTMAEHFRPGADS